jgi:molybdate transport system permease protein
MIRGSSRKKKINTAWWILFFIGLYYSTFVIFAYTKYNPVSIVKVLLSGEVLNALMLSILSSSTAAMFAMMAAIPASYALSRGRGRFIVILDTIVDIPLVLSPIALGALLLVFFTGGAGEMLKNIGIPVVFTFTGIVVAQFSIVTALAIRLLKSTFDSIDPRYEKIARTLGCTERQAFFKVALPMARGGIVASVVLVWARCMGEFGATIMLAGAMPGVTETLPVSIYLSFASADVERALAVTGVLLVISLASLAAIKYFSPGREIL